MRGTHLKRYTILNTAAMSRAHDAAAEVLKISSFPQAPPNNNSVPPEKGRRNSVATAAGAEYGSQRAGNCAYLKSILAKYEITDAVGIDSCQFLANIIQQFQLHVGKPVNYVCFLYNYFQGVSKDDWPNKSEILNRLKKVLPKLKKQNS